jgi:hypothetical protein
MMMISLYEYEMTVEETLKKYRLQFQEFANFAGIHRCTLSSAIKRNDEIYMKGLQVKLKEFFKWKIKQLREEEFK